CFVLIPYLSTRLTCLLFCSWYADSRDLHSSLHDALPISQDRRTIACGAAEHSQWSTFAESSTRFDQRAGGLTLRADNLAPATRDKLPKRLVNLLNLSSSRAPLPSLISHSSKRRRRTSDARWTKSAN